MKKIIFRRPGGLEAQPMYAAPRILRPLTLALLALVLIWAGPAPAAPPSQTPAFGGAQGRGYSAPQPQDAPWTAPPPTPEAESFVGARGQAGQEPPAPPAPEAAVAAPPTPKAGLDLLDRGEFAAAAGRFDEAERLWRQALAQRPDWGVVKQRLAELPARRARFHPDLAEQNRRREARLALVQGVTDFNAHRYPQAAANFQSYLAVFPEDQEAQVYLDLAQGRSTGRTPGQINVFSRPSAQVLVDGRLVGQTPLGVPASGGRHRVAVQAFGGGQAQEVSLPPGGEAQVSFTLLGGFLAVNASPWAEVFLDGQPVGHTPLTLENLVLGAHTITARHPSFPEQSRQVILEKDQIVNVSFTLDGR